MIYYLLFLAPFLISFFSASGLNNISKKIDFFDFPEEDDLKIHKHPISCFGGLAMLFAVVVGLLTMIIFEKKYFIEICGVLIGSAVIFCLGFWDDLKWKHISSIKPYRKFLFLIIFSFVASLFLVLFKSINFSGNLFLSTTIAFFYIFVFINSTNYQDGIDGLAGGLTLISAVGFAVLAVAHNDIFTIFLSVILIGAILGFLIHNFPPAKIFMGDSGAYFLGFMLVILALQPFKINSFSNILGPVFIVGFPIFEGIFTNIRRILSKNSIFHGDRMHLYDRLLNKNFSVRKTLFIIYFAQIILVASGVIISL